MSREESRRERQNEAEEQAAPGKSRSIELVHAV